MLETTLRLYTRLLFLEDLLEHWKDLFVEDVDPAIDGGGDVGLGLLDVVQDGVVGGVLDDAAVVEGLLPGRLCRHHRHHTILKMGTHLCPSHLSWVG